MPGVEGCCGSCDATRSVPHTNLNATNCATARLPEDDAPERKRRHGYDWTQHIGSHRVATLRLRLASYEQPDPVESFFTSIRYSETGTKYAM
jgi:hypothetical protein